MFVARFQPPLHKCSGDAVKRENMQSNLRTYSRPSSVRHVGESRQVQLMRHGDRLRRAIPVLAHDQVSFTAPRVVSLEGVRPVQEDDHIRILFERIMKTS